MWKYVLKRLGYIVIVFLIITFLMYMLFNLIPSDPAAAVVEPLRDKVDAVTFEELYQAQREKMGLNDPLMIRYLRWLGLRKNVAGYAYDGLLQGNLGTSSINNRPVIDTVKAPMKNTIILNLMSTFLTLGITIPLGIKTAVKKGSFFDQTMQVVTIVGHSLPQYIIGLAFIFLFAVKLGWFPVSGMVSANAGYTGTRLVLDRMWHYVLPLIVIVAANLGSMTRYVRAAMIDVLSMDYIRTARAKGLKEKVVIYSHAWRNALLPVITQIISWFLRLFAGSVVIESTFAFSGMGTLNVTALNTMDYELAIAINLFFCIVSLLGILICDLAYGLVDPRIRVSK